MSGHYMTTIDERCACHHYPVRDPAEPQLGTWLEAEPNPACPVHFPRPFRIRRLVEPVPTTRYDEPAGQVVVGWVIEQRVQFAGMPEAEYVVVDYYPNGDAAIEAFAAPQTLVI
ncbi:hypothetical protein I5H06_gp40 [Mycobacterium phage SirPhilip]|uniref:Uncharacterized protein n=1 Tax=Mycobacterium phage SirPhilip TaxID=2015824 RepID=A0A222ZKI0_9CAUD|nr:hypothetical protein I5H06_gp40 [Mycobacterium phage SirPhilip]ASR85264.1 hypothetical protein SEA_SIRPHILIP_62 [Mycobacterium phage SirPhilip]